MALTVARTEGGPRRTLGPLALPDRAPRPNVVFRRIGPAKAYLKLTLLQERERANRGRRDTQKDAPKWANFEIIEAVWEMAQFLRDFTGADVVVDHIVPLKGREVSGFHVHENLRILDNRENRLKSNTLLPNSMDIAPAWLEYYDIRTRFQPEA